MIRTTVRSGERWGKRPQEPDLESRCLVASFAGRPLVVGWDSMGLCHISRWALALERLSVGRGRCLPAASRPPPREAWSRFRRGPRLCRHHGPDHPPCSADPDDDGQPDRKCFLQCRRRAERALKLRWLTTDMPTSCLPESGSDCGHLPRREGQFPATWCAAGRSKLGQESRGRGAAQPTRGLCGDSPQAVLDGTSQVRGSWNERNAPVPRSRARST